MTSRPLPTLAGSSRSMASSCRPGQRLEEVIATLPQRGTHELEVVRVVVSSARRVSRRLSHEATSAPSMLAEKKPGHAKKASARRLCPTPKMSLLDEC